ncbi:hypothetical protein D3C79_789760 [compost metagenome]
MDIDAGDRVGQLRTDPRQQRQAGPVQMVGQAVVDDGENTRVAQQHLIDAARRRVTVESGQHIGIEDAAQTRQGRGKVLDQAQGLGIDLGRCVFTLASDITQFKAGLGKQGGQGRVEGMADIKVFALFTQVDRAQAHREQGTTQLLENMPHRFARRQLTAALLAAAATIAAAPLIAGGTQLANDGLQLPMP